MSAGPIGKLRRRRILMSFRGSQRLQLRKRDAEHPAPAATRLIFVADPSAELLEPFILGQALGTFRDFPNRPIGPEPHMDQNRGVFQRNGAGENIGMLLGCKGALGRVRRLDMRSCSKCDSAIDHLRLASAAPRHIVI